MRVGITIGDINGVGPEVILKALNNELLVNRCTPIVYGSSKVLSYHKNTLQNIHINFNHINDISKVGKNKVNILNCWEETVEIQLGKATEYSGKYAGIALEKAVNDLKKKNIDALITAPINKEAMKSSGFKYPGHTEYITKEIGGKSLMMMVSDTLKVALVTNHIPIKDVSGKISKDLVSAKLNILKNSLKRDFGIEKPVIAVLGLNPHAGDGGAIGSADEDIIRPVVIEAKKKGDLIYGPFPADGFFGSASFKKFDAVLAMYHDQGLIPFKALSFGSGTNFTAGLSVIRTSPDHGTAFDIAGQNKADESSMLNALYNAIDIYKWRKGDEDARRNALDKKIRPSETGEEEDEILE